MRAAPCLPLLPVFTRHWLRWILNEVCTHVSDINYESYSSPPESKWCMFFSVVIRPDLTDPYQCGPVMMLCVIHLCRYLVCCDGWRPAESHIFTAEGHRPEPERLGWIHSSGEFTGNWHGHEYITKCLVTKHKYLQILKIVLAWENVFFKYSTSNLNIHMAMQTDMTVWP